MHGAQNVIFGSLSKFIKVENMKNGLNVKEIGNINSTISLLSFYIIGIHVTNIE